MIFLGFLIFLNWFNFEYLFYKVYIIILDYRWGNWDKLIKILYFENDRMKN